LGRDPISQQAPNISINYIGDTVEIFPLHLLPTMPGLQGWTEMGVFLKLRRDMSITFWRCIIGIRADLNFSYRKLLEAEGIDKKAKDL